MRDVDVLIVSTEWNIRSILSELKADFYERFGLPLHIQPFHISQLIDIESFIERAALVEEVL